MAIAEESVQLPQNEDRQYQGGLARTLVRTLLVFTFIPLLLMGGAAYLRARSLLRDQVAGQMQAQITDQVGDVDLAVKTKEIRLDRLVRSADFLAAVSPAVGSHPGSPELDAARVEFNRVARAVNPEAGRATFNQYLLMGPDGTIRLASNPQWEGLALSELPFYKELSESDHQSFTVYDSRPFYPDQLVLFTVSQVVSPKGTRLATMVGITEPHELQGILQNLATPNSGAQALFVTEAGTVIGTDPYTNQMAIIEAPASQTTPIMSALDKLMHVVGNRPMSVEFTDQAGTRAFGQVLWLDSLRTGIVYAIDENRVFGALGSLIPFTAAIVVVALIAMGVVLSVGARRVFGPLARLADITRRFSSGDFTQRAEARSRDEIGLLARSFNQMAAELSDLYRSLEDKVDERTRQIRTAAEVAERITSTGDLNELLTRTVELIVEQFAFYQASVFMIDRAGKFAVLQASSGPAAKLLLSRGHRLEVGSGSIIGWVTANNKPRIASDVSEDPIHFKNELLPETRAEVGIPIAAAGTVLGALDVQSTQSEAFGPETIVMLQLVANQIAVAIQNLSLVQSTQINFEELERLHRSSRLIAAASSREEAFETAARLLADSPYIALTFSMEAGRLNLEGRPEQLEAEAAPDLASLPYLEAGVPATPELGRGELVVITAGADSSGALAEFVQRLGYRSAGFVPILTGQNMAGILVLGSSKTTLTRALMEPYVGLAELLGTTLEKIAEAKAREKRLAERDSLTSIGQAITRSSVELGDFFAELHAQVRKNIGDYAFVVALYDAANQAISIPYAYEEGKVSTIEAFPLGEGLTSIIIRTAEPLLLVEDVERRALKLGAKTVGKPARSWMGVPMLVRNQPVGALILEDLEREHAFNEENLRFFAELSDQVAAVIHNAQLLDQSRAHTFQLETAAEIARDVSGSLNLDELLARAVNYIRERLRFYHSSVFLLDPQNEFAVIREATGEAGAQMKRIGHKLGIGSKSIVGYVSGRGEPLIVNDTAKDATFLPNPLLPATRSEAALPLKVGERIVGVMDVQSTQPYAFHQDDVRTLQILADQLAVAVVNSELFAETQEHLSQHRLLHHITTSAASGTTLDEALESAVSGLQVTLGGDRVTILLTDQDANLLEVKAAAGYSEEILQLRVPIGSGITGWSAAHRRPLRVNNVLEDSRYIQASPNTRSELAVPLIYRNEVLGVLNVENEQTGAYTQNDEEMLGTLGGSLAAIIANARLLEQLRTQAERERALFEITGKIRRAPDMQSILATTASELTRVIGARRTTISVSTQGRNGESQEGTK